MRSLPAVLGLAAMLLAPPAEAGAGDAGATAHRQGGDLVISGTYLERNGCIRFQGIEAGAPEGEPPVANALPATITVSHQTGRACTMAITPVAFRLVVESAEARFVILHYVTEMISPAGDVTRDTRHEVLEVVNHPIRQ